MSESLRLQAHPQAAVPHGPCVLCGQPWPGVRSGVGLYDGRMHLGDMCRGCLAAGRRGATARARERVVMLRKLDQQVTANSSAETRQIDFVPWLRRYADYLEGLAGRLELMTGWSLVEQAST